MFANAILCCSDSFNTGVILPCTVLGIVLFLFFIHCTFTGTACFRHRHANFAKRQDAGQTPDGSIEAEVQKLRTLAPADFGHREATDPSSKASSVVPGVHGIDGELSNVQAED